MLAISGFGGLALGLAGREILENLFNGLLIISNRSFDVGEEILFTQSGHAGRIIEGIVLDIGWYQTLVRSFEREIYVIPNSVFSRTVVLNVTRKGKEWRFFESVGIRVEDIDVVNNVVADMRRIIRQVRVYHCTIPVLALVYLHTTRCSVWYRCCLLMLVLTFFIGCS